MACGVIHEMPSLLVTPLVKAVIKAVTWAVVLYGFLLLWTTGELVTAGDGMSRTFSHPAANWGYIVWFMFMSFWVLAFMDAVYQFTVAFAVAEYYYTPMDPMTGLRQSPWCSLFDGLELALITHCGSLAFGSCIVAIVQTAQKMVEYAEKKKTKRVQTMLSSRACSAVSIAVWGA